MTEDNTIYRWYLPERAKTAHATVNAGPGKGGIVCGKAVGYGRTVYGTRPHVHKNFGRNLCVRCLRDAARLALAAAPDREPTPAT